ALNNDFILQQPNYFIQKIKLVKMRDFLSNYTDFLKGGIFGPIRLIGYHLISARIHPITAKIHTINLENNSFNSFNSY
ncbi:hypothetical protein BpHYR1_020388, partial [Brachionus plicatilis]